MSSFLDVALAAAGLEGSKVVKNVKIVDVNRDGGISPGTDRTAPGYELTKPTEAPELRRNAAFVSFGGAIPCPFPKIEASSAWPPCSSCGRTSGFTFTDTDPVNRCLCGEPRPDPPPPVCIRCHKPVGPEAMFCRPCFSSRRKAV